MVLSSSAEEPLWWDLDTQSEVQPLRIGAGRAVFWWGKDQTWLVTSNARALQWPPKGPAQPVDLPTITNNGPCKIPLAGTKGMLAWGDASEVRVRESEPEAELRMEGGNARTDTYEVGNGVTHLLAKETSRYLARVDGGTSVWFLDRSSKQARWTSSGSLHGGHPYSGAIHPTVPLVATFSGCIALFDLEAAEHIEDFAGPNELGSKWEGEFSPDGRFLVLRSGDHLFAMDLITRAVRLLLSVPGASRGDSVRGAMTFSPDGRFLVVATGGHAYAIEWSQLEGLWNRSPWVRMVRPVQTL